MSLSTYWSAVVFLAALFYVYFVIPLRRRNRLPLPPGPSPLPILGNFFDFPKGDQPWLQYRELGKQYGGGMLFLQAMGRCMLVINNANIAIDLLEKRSATYSSRPASSLIDIVGWEWNFAFMAYGQRWRRHRRMFWQYFNPTAVTVYHPAQEDGARRLLTRLLSDPCKLNEHLRYSLGTASCKATHGLDVAEHEDPKLAIFEKAVESNDLLIQASPILEYFPFLARTPTWLPGTSFLHRIADNYTAAHSLRDLPWNMAKELMEAGHSRTSMASSILEKVKNLDPQSRSEEELVGKSSLALAYAAGLDTQHASMQTFFVACTLYPEVQRRAQAELDAVVGPNRLPTFADRGSLHYVNALLKEMIRWHDSVPLGVPHRSTADDVYNGYFIPSNTICVVNAWSILRDPANYPEPDKFMPERFLKDGKLNNEVRDPGTIAFGFGRRNCPGRHFADSTLFLFVAYVLHVFNISPPLDNSGKEIEIKPRASSSLVSFLEDWECIIRPRSARAEALVEQLYTADDT